MSRDDPAVAAALKRFEDRFPETIELSLGRIRDLLDRLGRPHDRLPPVIHVAGTNGKGSTCAFLRAMAEASGLSVHVFSSPHLVRFNERIRLAGQLVSDDAMTDYLARTLDALGDAEITHFEATTAAALLAFSEVPADLLILEVGLGGRFDATNVIDAPAVSVITPVAHDHKQFLGDDLAGIAGEKAGIIKQGRPVVSALQAAVSARRIREVAESLDAPLHRLRLDDQALVPAVLSLKGAHQRLNAALAAKALLVWGHDAITRETIFTGAGRAVWPARMQTLKAGPVTVMAGGAEVWLDGGHNPHAAAAIAGLIGGLGGRTVLVSAMMASKDHANVFAAFEGIAEAVHTCPNAAGHQGADPTALAEAAGQFVPATPHDSFAAAMQAAATSAPDRILICGSLYLAGDVLFLNGEVPD